VTLAGWLWVASAVLTMQGQQAVRDTEIKPTVGTASVSGIVVTAEATPEPVRRAIVTLAGPELRPSRGTVTDDEGRFTIANLPAGRFTLTVTRAAFITSVYGAKRPGRPGTAIAVRDGERVRDLTVQIWRGAAVAGVVRDETGVPVEGIGVRAIPARALSTPTVLTLSNNGAPTNERGEFRIFGLEPGTYVISARPAAGGSSEIHAFADAEVDAALAALRRRVASGPPGQPPADGATPAPQSFDYAPIYYPGTTVLAQATAITLAAGVEQTGLDFALQRVPTAFVEGIVMRPDGQPAPNTTLQMTAVVPSGPFASEPPLQLNTTSAADGSFRINQVTPGPYQLIARGSAASPPGRPPAGGLVMPDGPSASSLWAVHDLSVSGADVRGVVLTLQPGVTMSGRVVFESEGRPAPSDLTRLRVNLALPQLLNARPGTVITTIAFVPSASVRADGTFEFPNVPPGSFQFLVGGAPLTNTEWWVRSALAGDRDLLDGLVQVRLNEPIPSVLITVTDRGTELSGTLQSAAGAPVSDLFVIAYAADRRFWGPHARRVQGVRPGVDGAYAIRNLPPGEYLLSAVTDVDPEEWHDPAFLERLVPASLKIAIADGEKKVQNLRIGG
jgi:hypothetical protein